MEERTLLYMALATALLGILGLFFLPELPPESVQGTITWSNGTNAWLSVCDDVWVEFSEEQELVRYEEVNLTGRLRSGTLASALPR